MGHVSAVQISESVSLIKTTYENVKLLGKYREVIRLSLRSLEPLLNITCPYPINKLEEPQLFRTRVSPFVHVHCIWEVTQPTMKSLVFKFWVTYPIVMCPSIPSYIPPKKILSLLPFNVEVVMNLNLNPNLNNNIWL